MENLNKPSTVNVEVEPSAGEPSDNIGQTTTAQSDDNTVVENPNLDAAWDEKIGHLEKTEAHLKGLEDRIVELQEKKEKTEKDLAEIKSTLKDLETYRRYVKMSYYACERLLEKADEAPTDEAPKEIWGKIMAEAREKFPAPEEEPTEYYGTSTGQITSTREEALASEPETRYRTMND